MKIFTRFAAPRLFFFFLIFFLRCQCFLFLWCPRFLCVFIGLSQGHFLFDSCNCNVSALLPVVCRWAAAVEWAWPWLDGISGNLYMHATGRRHGWRMERMGSKKMEVDKCSREPDKVKSTFAIPASLTAIRSHATPTHGIASHRNPYRFQTPLFFLSTDDASPVSYPFCPLADATQRATQLISIESPAISLYSLIYVNGKYFN